jgi:hypothetical protein
MSDARRNVGRVIFRTDHWVVPTLQCHVDNVTRLVELWDAHQAYLYSAPAELACTRELVITAARIHDMAKPSHFRLIYANNGRRPAKWEYSFAGHRFGVEHDHLYVYLLGQLHHEYSVGGMAMAISRLRNCEATTEIAHCFPLDLYTLEMADQIEATVARAALGEAAPEERVFMDFAFQAEDAGQTLYRLDPFPFRQETVGLVVEYVEWIPPRELVAAVESAPSADKRAHLLRDLQAALLNALQSAPLQTKEITLWPWS